MYNTFAGIQANDRSAPNLKWMNYLQRKFVYKWFFAVLAVHVNNEVKDF